MLHKPALHLIAALLLCAPAMAASPWQAYNLAPSSRTVNPVAVYTSTGLVNNPANVLSGQVTTLSGQGSSVTLDFGKEVGGIVTLTFTGASSANESVGLAFTESSDYVGPNSDGSNSGINSGASGPTDGAIFASVGSTGASVYTMPLNKLRGGFRYLTLFLNSSGSVQLSGVKLAFSPAPTMQDPSAYPNYFYSNDTLLNQLWYAGAYTAQTNTIVPTTGRVYPLATGWDNSATISGGTTVLTDGAKRDRAVWPGDVGISGATTYVSTNDTTSLRNVLQRMYDSQNSSSGELPYAGPPFNFAGSDTYHLWSLIGTYNYYLYSGDQTWLGNIWARYRLGMQFSLNKVNGAHGLMNVTGTADWARNGQGGENIAANAMLYHALVTGVTLANAAGDTASAALYSQRAATLKANINAALWDTTMGAYRDNPGSTLYPQDGNSLAVWFDVVDSQDHAAQVASYLKSNWNAYGSRTPEWNGNISPFAGSMELMAQAKALRDTDLLALIRREWGYMFNSPRGTKTFWEGYGADGSANGYSPWFMSYSHGWSSGPTSALTFYVLGITPLTAKGATYSVIPHPGDLTHVEGQLTVDNGKLVKVYYDNPAAGSFAMTVDSQTNTDSSGVVAVPRGGLSRSVTINGSTAWDGQRFTGSSGIASADQDDYYVYFRGVQPGLRSFVASPAAGTWSTCASENAECVFSGVKGIRYGSGTTFVYGRFADSVSCSNGVFGDPTPNVAKHCELSQTQIPPVIGVWHLCAQEGQQCSFTGTHTVAYGASGTYVQASKTGGVSCDNSVFTDPAYGLVKQCYYADLPQNPSFETPAITDYSYAPANAAWSFSAQASNSGTGIEHTGGSFGAAAAADGTQAAFLQSGATLSQTLTNLNAGNYSVSFAAARRNYSGGGQQTFTVYLDNVALGSFSPTSTVFTYFSTAATPLTAGNHVLKFVGTNLSGDNTAFIDAVSLLNE